MLPGIIGLVVIIGLIWAVVTAIKTWRANRGPARRDMLVLTQKYHLALGAIQAIAAGAGAPILEATEALDKIHELEIKELS